MTVPEVIVPGISHPQMVGVISGITMKIVTPWNAYSEFSYNDPAVKTLRLTKLLLWFGPWLTNDPTMIGTYGGVLKSG